MRNRYLVVSHETEKPEIIGKIVTGSEEAAKAEFATKLDRDKLEFIELRNYDLEKNLIELIRILMDNEIGYLDIPEITDMMERFVDFIPEKRDDKLTFGIIVYNLKKFVVDKVVNYLRKQGYNHIEKLSEIIEEVVIDDNFMAWGTAVDYNSNFPDTSLEFVDMVKNSDDDTFVDDAEELYGTFLREFLEINIEDVIYDVQEYIDENIEDINETIKYTSRVFDAIVEAINNNSNLDNEIDLEIETSEENGKYIYSLFSHSINTYDFPTFIVDTNTRKVYKAGEE